MENGPAAYLSGQHDASGIDLGRIYQPMKEARDEQAKERDEPGGGSPGVNVYGWGNGKARKRPREIQTPVGQINKTSPPYYKGEREENQA